MPKGIDLRKLASKEYQAKKAAQDASTAYKVTNPDLPGLAGGAQPPKVVDKQKAATSDASPPKKKARITEASSAPSKKAEQTKTARPTKKGKSKEGDAAEGSAKEKIDPDEITVLTSPESPAEPFEPSFVCPNGHAITSHDSVAEDANVAITMLEALRLPKDMRNVPSNAERNATAICQLVA